MRFPSARSTASFGPKPVRALAKRKVYRVRSVVLITALVEEGKEDATAG